ncbi:MAG: ABC transporter permease [Ignavibacteriales bacterium]|nr:ABC transporter permease [Ignavibacteriales bacterium]MCB9209675.1 ABC transporter permease [Ignavibacteriales bacterium]MCB9218831.1 ABC transporter permease [Ignavibacteriales bacterium]
MSNFLYELKEGLIISFNAIRANKIRSILTTLGIVIGVASVVLMSTAIKGIDESFQDSATSIMGTDNIFIDKWAWFGTIPWWELRSRPDIVMEDFKEFKQQATLPLAVAPRTIRRKNINYGDAQVDGVFIVGTNQDYINTTELKFTEGRFFSAVESNAARRVCVVGGEVAAKLFPLGNGLDQIIKIDGKKYQVVGINDKQGSFLFGDFNPDNMIYLPIQAMFKDFQSRHRGGGISITVRAPSNAMVPAVKEEAISVMRRIRGLKYDEDDNFSINQQDALLDMINQQVGVIQIAGLFITGLALFVGAIGIMNIMFVSVKERTREIGIRKAIGAKKRTILGQFISESAFICLIGGLIGLFIAVLGAKIIEQYDFPVSVQIDAVILAIGISLLTGVISGIAPAYTAAKMDAVDALRYE